MCSGQGHEDGGKCVCLCGKILKSRDATEERIGMQPRKGKYHRKYKLGKTLMTLSLIPKKYLVKRIVWPSEIDKKSSFPFQIKFNSLAV